MTPPDPAVSEIALIRQNRTCKTGIQLAILEIQANRGCSKGAEWSARQNIGKNNFVGPKMQTPPDSVLTLNCAVGFLRPKSNFRHLNCVICHL